MDSLWPLEIIKYQIIKALKHYHQHCSMMGIAFDSKGMVFDAGAACRRPFVYFSGVNNAVFSITKTVCCARVKEIRFTLLGSLLAYSTS
ncbi:hypothetical protein H5410_045821 [Solanum commersonii]|uniref:Uncharacterized protein n=1 Tax=Solanum commersonii TaxID=4109 RepID=A0A9J5XAM1_SOLCO|nr:hypothetical protein H5410_045821 [Solanum commersonii]